MTNSSHRLYRVERRPAAATVVVALLFVSLVGLLSQLASLVGPASLVRGALIKYGGPSRRLDDDHHCWRSHPTTRGAAAGGQPPLGAGPQWEPDWGATAFVQELTTKDWEEAAGGGSSTVKVLQLTRPLFVRPYIASGPALFSRNSSRLAWNATFELLSGANPNINRVAMRGRPGIGKSRSLFFGLRELLLREQPPEAVIFEARPAGRVFRFAKDSIGKWEATSMGLRKWEPEESDDLKNPQNWYLIDAAEAAWVDVLVNAMTVKACNPDKRHHSDFIKDGGTCTYVNDWTLDEVLEAHPHLLTRVTTKTIHQRFKTIGGNLRVLLGEEADFEGYEKQMQQDATNSNLWKKALFGILDSTVPTRLFTFDSSPDGNSYEVRFVTKKAIQWVVKEHYEDVLREVGKGNTGAFTLEDFVGDFFLTGGLQALKARPEDSICLDAVQIELERKKSTSSWKRTTKTKAFEIPPNRTLRTFDTWDAFKRGWKEAVQKKNLSGHRVWRTPPLFPAIDFLIEYNHGVSVATADKHGIAKVFLEKLRHVNISVGTGFTLTFLTTRNPNNFIMNDKAVAQDLLDKGATIQVVQIPGSPESIP